MTAAPVDILLVEDNEGDILLARKAFERTKVLNALHVVRDGEAALDFLNQRGEHADAPRPDLVLLDINLPKLDGHEVLAEIKASPDLRRIPVVMLTSSDRPSDIEASYAAHANSYITKPPDLSKLAEAVKSLEEYWFVLVKRPT